MFTEILLSIWNVKHQHFCGSPLSAVPFLGTYIQWVPFPGALIFTTGTYRQVPSVQGLCFSTPRSHHGMTIDGPIFFQQMEAKKSWRSWRSCCKSGRKPYHLLHCLVVSTPLKNISQLGWLFPIYMENKCSKPPTSIISAMLSSFLSVHTSWHPQEMYFLCTRF